MRIKTLRRVRPLFPVLSSHSNFKSIRREISDIIKSSVTPVYTHIAEIYTNKLCVLYSRRLFPGQVESDLEA